MEAGREIPPPPDYEGMLEEVRDEVEENFAFPKDATKVKKTAAAKAKKDDAADSDGDSDEEAEDAEADDADD